MATSATVDLWDAIGAGAAHGEPALGGGAAPAELQEREPSSRRSRRSEYRLGLETIYEGYLLHYGTSRLFAPEDGDTALLLGDYLYAHGLVRIADHHVVDAVADLGELI